MGFISRFLSTEQNTDYGNVPGKLSNFLNKVDSLYMEAYALKSAKDISVYLSRPCAQRLQSAVCSLNNRYFGDAKYRKTVWSKKNENESYITILKKVEFDKVKIAGKLSINIASDYSEIWTIAKSRSNFIVDKIESVDVC